ncbi:MAG TPA: acyl carrier protein [Spirochaetota bacterium]|nr:acyl carrier protein [Spirochaetota bacterium]OQA96895.1 MAG: Acyl carrier protein [Spirochaetes bacterium ADurb.Bin218]HOK01953.1 acyl carrier protein [Spirochaetota bacterium]HOK91629.1 acyl carrier protein [Spirochaetota bacterium]HON15914.1 acyl carrier protein [Spirochaetota bacterium]
MDDIIKRVNRIISNQLEIDEDKLSENTSLIDDLAVDSIDTVELIIAFEVEFDLEIPDEEAEKLRTLGDIYKYIYRKISER